MSTEAAVQYTNIMNEVMEMAIDGEDLTDPPVVDEY